MIVKCKRCGKDIKVKPGPLNKIIVCGNCGYAFEYGLKEMWKEISEEAVDKFKRF